MLGLPPLNSFLASIHHQHKGKQMKKLHPVKLVFQFLAPKPLQVKKSPEKEVAIYLPNHVVELLHHKNL